MKHSDYLKKKKTRETRKKIISVISAIVVFITTYALVLPAITLDVSKASQEPGIAYEQMQFKATAAAASVTAADSTVEEAQVEEPAAEEPEEEPAEVIEEEPAETPEEETSAVSAEEEEKEEPVEEAPAEPEQEEAPAEPEQEKEEAPEVREDKSEADSADEKSSGSAPSEAEAADTQKAAEDTAVDQSGTDTAEAAAAATTEAAPEFKVPELDALDFDEILTGKTNFYYYHVENAEEAEEISSDSIDDWKKVNSDTVLAPEDFVRVYLSYEIPAGALNETNAVARYTLPTGLELSDKQIKAINKYENGIAASKSGSERDKYLGAEAIEGSRTPDEKADDEYIAATVKVKKTDSGRQELVFTFIPYTVEKNQISYDEKGEVKSKGKEVRGFFTFDLKTSQIGFEKTNIETVDKEDGTAEEIQYSEAKFVFADEDSNWIERALTLAAPVEKEEAREPKTLTSEGPDYTVTVSYTDEAQIPDNAKLEVSEIGKDTPEYESYLEQAKGAVGDETKSVNEARFFDITILVDGEKVEPKAPVSVQINFAGIEQTNTDDTQLLHYKDSEDVEVMDKAEFSKSEEQAVDTVQFETERFSVYGIVGTETITVDYLTADGKTLKVTVTFDENEVIPAGAELEVKEISEDEEGWMDRSLRLGEVLQEKYGYVVISDARFLDIKIKVDGEEFEPKESVEVRVEYSEEFDTEYTYDYVNSELKPEEIELGPKHFAMVHYVDDSAEVLESNITEGDGCITESVSQTTSFSEYDVAYFTEDKNDDVDRSGQLPSLEIAGKSTSGVTTLGATKAAGTTPSHGKNLVNKRDGTYDIHLNVTGDADTTSEVSNVNVILVYDTSTSMNNSHNYDPYYVDTYTQNSTGRYGTDGNGNFFNLYYRSGGRYRTLNNDTYTGTVYSNAQGTEYNGNRYTQTRTTRADVAEPVVRSFVNSLYSYQDQQDPTNIQTTFITFNGSANARTSWTTNSSDITSYLVADGTNGSYNHASGFYASGTNWEMALRAVQSALNDMPDDDPTYVVFITDGAPTMQAGDTSSSAPDERYYIAARDEALAIQTAVNANGGDFYSIYAYGDETDWLATMMYYANNGVEPASGRGTTFNTKGYYNAGDTAALSAAIGEIFDAIVDTLGITSVSIEDGTTSNVELSTGGGATADLLDVNTDSFRYTLSWNVLSNGDGTYSFTMPDKVTGEPVAYTVSVDGENITITWDGGSATYTGNIEINVLTVNWTASTDFYKFAPPAAQFVDPDVTWNLNGLGTLLSGVTYDVAFECYPTQYTLDLIADLKNGYGTKYEDLDENIRKYLQKSGDDYVLKTNTGATLYYTDSRTDDGPQHSDYNDPAPQSTAAAKSIAVSKDWSNILDDRDKPESMTMHVTRDNVDRYELVLNDADSWTDEAFISYGIMTIHEDGIHLKTTGHDYSFSEPADMEYYWELQVPTLRPMLINTVETLLVKVEESEAPAMSGENATAIGEDGYTYYKLTIDGTAEYYKVDEAVAHLKAENHRRSYLNVMKVVDEANAPTDAEFTYNIKVKDSNGEDVWFAAQTVEDAAAGNETYQLLDVSDNVTPEFRTVSGATYNAETNTYTYTYDGKTYTLPAADDGTGGYMYTGYYSVASDAVFTVKIKAGWNLRVINLPTGTTYSVTEDTANMPDESFTLESITGNRHYKDDEGAEQDETAGTVAGSGISGTIEYANSDYKMTFDNKYSTIDVQLKKVKEDGETIIGESVFKLTKKNSSGTYVEINDTLNSIQPGDTDETNPVDLGGLGIAEYRLTETDTPPGYVKLTSHVDFEVYKEDGTLKAKMADGTDAAVASIDTDDDGNYIITVVNTPGAALPHTGGPGTFLYTLGGLMLVIASALMYGFRMRRRERRLN